MFDLAPVKTAVKDKGMCRPMKLTVQHGYFVEALAMKHSIGGETLRIDTGGWSVNFGAPSNEASIKCSLLNYYMLYIIK